MLWHIVPGQVNAREFGARPILAHFVIFVEDSKKVIGMLFSHILHADIINYEDKLYQPSGIFPQACRSWCFEGLVLKVLAFGTLYPKWVPRF